MVLVETVGRGAHSKTYGRNDLEAFFAKSGRLELPYLDHTPFLAFLVVGDRVTVNVVRSAMKLATDFPPETPVMIQWPGRFQSDFFRMTAGDVRDELVRRGVLGTLHIQKAEATEPVTGRCHRCGRTTTDAREFDAPCGARLPHSLCSGVVIVTSSGLDT